MYTTYYPPVTAVPTTFWVPRNIAIVTVLSIVGLICFVSAIVACATGEPEMACCCCMVGMNLCAAVGHSSYNPKEDQSMKTIGQNQEDEEGKNQEQQLNNMLKLTNTSDKKKPPLEVNG